MEWIFLIDSGGAPISADDYDVGKNTLLHIWW